MIVLTLQQAATLQEWFVPERPGPLVGMHVINTGNGVGWVDRWPAPRVALMSTSDNYILKGDPHACSAAELRARIRGFVESSENFLPLLKAAFPDCKRWDRVIFEQRNAAKYYSPNVYEVRRLTANDAHHLWGLSPDNNWIYKTWGGPNALAASDHSWGAFVEGQLASVACTFYLGEKFEDIGVVTEPQFRRRGLNTACAAALCEDIRARGHQPSWTTSPDNLPSIRVAEKLGFTLQRRDVLYVVGIPIPEPVQPYCETAKKNQPRMNAN